MSQIPGRVVALDPGERRIGIAISDSSRTMALVRPALSVTDRVVDDLVQLIDDECATCVVVGLPKALSGSEGSSAQKARVLAGALTDRLGPSSIEVVLHDERLTTVQASQTMRAAGKDSRAQRSSIDSAAAAILLEAWLQCQ
ncbi:MAG: Holliday junction resolvase RuvX [Actinomycetes bacterium]